VKSLLITVAAGLLAASSVQAGQPTKQTGEIIVYRPFSMTGAAVGFPFGVDNGPTIKVRNGYYYRLTVTPGQHVIKHRFLFNHGDPQKVQVEAGQTVYFLYTAHLAMGNIFEVAEDQAEASHRCTQLKAQN
jgi:hypothetical protein